MIGQKFNLLTVVERAGTGKNRDILWLCKCDCGGETVSRRYTLQKGLAKSCGCLQRAQMKKAPLRLSHGMSNTPTYRSWSSMKNRVSNKNADNYKYYGGRGITIDPSWRKFENFLRDMGSRPYNAELDRTDNNGSYCKSNCKWVNKEKQMNNRRRNFIISHKGEVKTLAEWCKKLELPYEKTRNRLRYLGWSVDKAFLGNTKNG
jgi:hypothetical protein